MGARCSAVFFLAIGVVATSNVAAQDDPINKPTSNVTVATRLPAPSPITARQLTDGRIEVRWAAVEGAARYELWRSVPPTGIVVISRANPSETTYVDSDVKAGSTYYYQVAAISSAGVGLKVGSTPVTATISAGGSTTTTTTTTTTTSPTAPQTASLRLIQPPTVERTLELSFSDVPGATSYTVEEFFYQWMSADPTQMDPSKRILIQRTNGVRISPFTYPVFTYEYPVWVQFQITPQLASGPGTPVLSPIVFNPGKGKVVDIGRATTVKVGGTASVVQNYGGCRWISLDEQIATVNSSGTATGVRPGVVQILCVKSFYENPMYTAFVAAIPLSVTP